MQIDMLLFISRRKLVRHVVVGILNLRLLLY